MERVNPGSRGAPRGREIPVLTRVCCIGTTTRISGYFPAPLARDRLHRVRIHGRHFPVMNLDWERARSALVTAGQATFLFYHLMALAFAGLFLWDWCQKPWRCHAVMLVAAAIHTVYVGGWSSRTRHFQEPTPWGWLLALAGLVYLIWGEIASARDPQRAQVSIGEIGSANVKPRRPRRKRRRG